jgi:hypothetical protein
MRRIDEQFTTRPFLGSRRMTILLRVRWRVATKARPGRSAQRLRTCWTTQERCPHAYSPSNNSKPSLWWDDRSRDGDGRDFQLRKTLRWS